MAIGLETLLSIGAIDKLDPAKHRTLQSREVRKLKGVGKFVVRISWGLPMAVICRKSQ